MFAVYATNLTAYLVASGDYQLIKLSPLSPFDRAWGLVFGTLHHVRFFIVLSMGSMSAIPAMIVSSILIGSSPPLSLTIAVILIMISLAGMPIVGLLAGITASLKYKESVQAISIAAGFTLSVTILLILGIVWLGAVRLKGLVAVVASTPFLLIVGAFHLAEQWA